MAKKVTLYGDGLKLLDMFVRYAKAEPEKFADIMYYDQEVFESRLSQLAEQLDAGDELIWDEDTQQYI